jgi:hypothetical protein
MRAALLEAVQNGISLAEAREIMLKEGFKFDTNVVNGIWKREKGWTFLKFERLDGTPPFKRLWQVALFHDGNKLIAIYHHGKTKPSHGDKSPHGEKSTPGDKLTHLDIRWADVYS